MMNPDAVGTQYPEVMFTVDPERVAAFRELFGQNEGVPPTFVTVAEFTVFPQVIGDPNLGLDLRRVLHGSQEYQLWRPLREGETLRVRTRLEQIRRRAGTGFVTIATELVDDADQVVATARSTMIEREPG